MAPSAIPREIWIYTVDLHPRFEQAAAAGGPQGEIVSRRSLVHGLSRLGCSPTQIPSLREFALRQAFARILRRPRALVLDRWTLAMARRYRLLGQRDEASLRLLDWFGIGENAESMSVPAARHLTPFPHPAHGFLGFPLPADDGYVRDADDLRVRLERAWLARTGRPRQVFAWGKEPRYFDEPARRWIAELVRSGVRVVTTIDRGRGFDAELERIGVTNLGHLNGRAFRDMLHETSVITGLGDPVLGPTPIEGLLAGCAYVNPVFDRPRVIEEGRATVASQHPYCESIPEPFVFAAPGASTLQVTLRALDAGTPSPEATGRLLTALKPYSEAEYLARLTHLLAAPA